MRRPDGRIYDGEWFNGKQHGIGTYINSQGDKRDAEWANGKRLGWISNDNRQDNNLMPANKIQEPQEPHEPQQD